MVTPTDPRAHGDVNASPRLLRPGNVTQQRPATNNAGEDPMVGSGRLGDDADARSVQAPRERLFAAGSRSPAAGPESDESILQNMLPNLPATQVDYRSALPEVRQRGTLVDDPTAAIPHRSTLPSVFARSSAMAVLLSSKRWCIT